MSPEWVGVIIGGLTLAIGLMGNIIVTVWWASKITTTLEILRSAVEEIKAERKTFATKEEIARELGIADKENKAIWKNIDDIKLLLNHNGNSHHGQQ